MLEFLLFYLQMVVEIGAYVLLIAGVVWLLEKALRRT